ncbi:nitrilase family protein [Vibrio furnissii]|uniref:nitrilase family protein n=1 Tax=Vibrio furnissii TaxID=29494 RepID=UPI0001B91B41|nr:nitrilase family protein [Vibrio furnissii]EEX40478.1 nitrilase/cyanide hydratase and apolipoprotein N-acyltransferase [Vibrio furnissii CIP 102972]QDC95165.1 acyltransferase [Vibrio furnissii]UON50601.1 nitrilase family protein [Vibrio furnissii]SUQ32879.1 putative amidohydrolase [Vibrio furnissii]
MKDIRVASVQFNHRANDKVYNLSIIEQYVEQAAREHVAIIVFPEMCITGYWHVSTLTKSDIVALAEYIPHGETSQALLAMSMKHNISIGAGLIEQDAMGNLYNAYVMAMPDGNIATHRKLHTFISQHMTSGNEYTVFDTPHGCRLGILICWDNNLVENARITALKGADILIAPHQTGGCNSRSPNAMGPIDPQLWYNRQQNPDAIRAEMQGAKGREWLIRWLPARAHDNGMFLIFSNGVGVDMDEVRTGNAMIIDPYGQIIAETDSVDNDMVIADLNADALTMCTGRRWIRGRRPALYQPLTVANNELSPFHARFSEQDIE